MDGRGKYFNQIINGLWALCETTYWGLSATTDLQRCGPGLPDIKESIIELRVGEVANLLSWTYYFFHSEFDKRSKRINERIEYEINRRILEPYYSRNNFWWIGFNGGFVNNRNPWCNYNVLTAIVLFENDPVKRQDGILKTMSSVDYFINYYKKDGACEEGVTYWKHTGGKLYEYLLLLQAISKKKLIFLISPLSKT
ncbi:MAG: hypothetical protein MJB12_04680 [Firmicutes bacterium]|nr:hypothetical protein [Bacillota bacterium]